jgi:hypothetical protein
VMLQIVKRVFIESTDGIDSLPVSIDNGASLSSCDDSSGNKER